MPRFLILSDEDASMEFFLARRQKTKAKKEERGKVDENQDETVSIFFYGI